MTNIYLANCNCILYHMPRLEHDIPICGRNEIECVSIVKHELQMGTNDSYKCECFYGCNAIKFEMGFSATPIFEFSPTIKKKGLNAANTSILHIYYQRGYYRGQDREELIGFTEFLCKNYTIFNFTTFLRTIYNLFTYNKS